MERVLRHCSFGFFYGSRSGATIGGLAALYQAFDSFFRLSGTEPMRGFFGGYLLLLAVSVVIGFILGSIGGFIFGLLGSFARNSFGWSISGIIGGLVSSCLFIWLVWVMGRLPERPNFLSFLLDLNPIILLPSVILGITGWIAGSAVRDGHPSISHLDWIRNQ